MAKDTDALYYLDDPRRRYVYRPGGFKYHPEAPAFDFGWVWDVEVADTDVDCTAMTDAEFDQYVMRQIGSEDAGQ